MAGKDVSGPMLKDRAAEAKPGGKLVEVRRDDADAAAAEFLGA